MQDILQAIWTWEVSRLNVMLQIDEFGESSFLNIIWNIFYLSLNVVWPIVYQSMSSFKVSDGKIELSHKT